MTVLSRILNKNYIYNYFDFFNKSQLYYFLLFETINLSVNEQNRQLQKLRHLSTFLKIRKRVLRSFMLLPALSRHFLYNPIVIKIHSDDLVEFISVFSLLYTDLLLNKKLTKCFFDFPIILYEMRIFYYFNSFYVDYLGRDKINLYQVYTFIYLKTLSILSVVFRMLFLLQLLICRRINN